MSNLKNFESFSQDKFDKLNQSKLDKSDKSEWESDGIEYLYLKLKKFFPTGKFELVNYDYENEYIRLHDGDKLIINGKPAMSDFDTYEENNTDPYTVGIHIELAELVNSHGDDWEVEGDDVNTAMIYTQEY